MVSEGPRECDTAVQLTMRSILIHLHNGPWNNFPYNIHAGRSRTPRILITMRTGNRHVRLLVQSPQLLREIGCCDDLGAPLRCKGICILHQLLKTTVGVLRDLLACVSAQHAGDCCMGVFGARIAETLDYGVPGFSRGCSRVFGTCDDIRERSSNPEKPLVNR